MNELEQKFDRQLRLCCERAQALTGIGPGRLLQDAERHGAAAAVRRQLQRRQVSAAFDALAKQGALEYSVEALAARGQFGALFSDEEINFCFEVLVEAGYYGGAR